MRVSLSPKEVAELHLLLAQQPLPPLPVHVDVHNGLDREANTEAFNCFSMCMLQVSRDASTGDRIVNSQSVQAALLMYHRWTPSDAEATRRMAARKDRVMLELQYAIFQRTGPTGQTVQDATEIYTMFLELTQAWLDCMCPEGCSVTLRPVQSVETLGHEHACHIVLAHYCFAQGVMYSAKSGLSQCQVHDVICQQYRDMVREAAADPDSAEAKKIDAAAVRNDIMEQAEIYSKNAMPKLFVLCFTRLKNDCLYGYQDARAETAFVDGVRLLEQSVEKFHETHPDIDALELDMDVLWSAARGLD